MGARTQMIIECVNHDGTHKTKAYHFGWGAGRPMFMVLNAFLTKVGFLVDEVDKLSDCLRYLDTFGLGTDLEKELRMNILQCKQGIKTDKKYLNSHPDCTFRQSVLHDVNTETRWLRGLRRGLREIRDIRFDDMQTICKFLEGCDNNNGALVVRFTAGEWRNSERTWGVELMIIPGNEDTGCRVQYNKPVTPRQYMKRYPLCTEEFVEMVKSTLRYWEVKVIS